MGACDDYACYCSVSDVFNATGMDYDRIIELSIRHSKNSQVDDLIEEYIADSTKEINERLGINTTIRKELHLGTGEDDIFELGYEQEEGYYHDVQGRLVDVINVYMGGETAKYRKLRPYPTSKDYIGRNDIALAGCELGTEVSTLVDTWDDSTASDALWTTDYIAGVRSIALDFSAAFATEYGRFPSITQDKWIDKNIDIFDYVAFYARTSVDNVTVTIRLYDKDGNYNYASYELEKKDHWYLVMFDIDDDFSGTVTSWDDTNLMYIEFWVDAQCTLIIDNLNFNDGWMYTAPAGEVAIMREMTDEPLPENYPFYVTYRYNPYYDGDSMVARNIKKAAACLAGVDLIDFVSGIRMEETEFDVQSESGVTSPTKDKLAILRERLLKRYEEAMKATGFGWEFIPVKGC